MTNSYLDKAGLSQVIHNITTPQTATLYLLNSDGSTYDTSKDNQGELFLTSPSYIQIAKTGTNIVINDVYLSVEKYLRPGSAGTSPVENYHCGILNKVFVNTNLLPMRTITFPVQNLESITDPASWLWLTIKTTDEISIEWYGKHASSFTLATGAYCNYLGPITYTTQAL